MATIQIREVPEAAYEVLRRRARRACQSIQAYLLGEVVKLAARPSKSEAIGTIEATLARASVASPTTDELLRDLAAGGR